MAIGVDIEGLESSAQRVDTIASNFSSEMQALGNLVNETAQYMQGGPQESFEAKYREFQKTMENFVGALNTYSAAMKSYAADQRATVQSGTRRFDSI